MEEEADEEQSALFSSSSSSSSPSPLAAGDGGGDIEGGKEETESKNIACSTRPRDVEKKSSTPFLPSSVFPAGQRFTLRTVETIRSISEWSGHFPSLTLAKLMLGKKSGGWGLRSKKALA